MIKHTPGPWVAERRSTMVATAIDGAYGYELFDVRCDVPEFEANASLIAAAPDLLEAIKAMIDEFRALDLPYGSEAYTKAVSAYNKATGCN